MKHLRPLLVPLALLLPACLENDEELEIHPDGSVDVTLTAHGDVADLADGYPLPLEASWRLASDDARRWARTVGSETGSLETRARAAEWPSEPGKEPQAELAVARRFASVAEMPRTFAPESEPYRSAHLVRETALAIEPHTHGKVYRFERVFHGFERGRIDPLGRTELPDEIQRKLDDEAELTPAERDQVVALLTAEHARAAEALVRDAVLGLVTDGGLAAGGLGSVLAAVQAASAALVTPERIDHLLALVRTDGDAAGKELEALEQEWRDTLRTSLGAALAKVAEDARNAALYALEWQFTAFDLAGDVGDEKFVLKVKLPGTLVAGNFARVEDGWARFEFDGEALQEHDVVLRATSVLE